MVLQDQGQERLEREVNDETGIVPVGIVVLHTPEGSSFGEHGDVVSLSLGRYGKLCMLVVVLGLVAPDDLLREGVCATVGIDAHREPVFTGTG